MKEKIISLTDAHSMKDLLNNNPEISQRLCGNGQKTKITILDHDTGRVLGEYSNKILITGSMFAGCKVFGINSPINLKSYNDEMHFDKDQTKKIGDYSASLVQLFCVGDDGCGDTQKDIFVCNYTDRIKPLTNISNPTECIGGIYPFRYVDENSDIPTQLRDYYFGRKSYGDMHKIAYFFKKFDSTPALHVKYTDGTQVDDNMYNSNTDQVAECYVETRLRINRDDFREFFKDVIGWDHARISSLSLCYAWEYEDEDGKIYYQDIYPYTKLNFEVEWLVNLDKAIDFNYQVYY